MVLRLVTNGKPYKKRHTEYLERGNNVKTHDTTTVHNPITGWLP